LLLVLRLFHFTTDHR